MNKISYVGQKIVAPVLVLQFSQDHCPKCGHFDQYYRTIEHMHEGQHVQLHDNGHAQYKFPSEGFVAKCRCCDYEWIELLEMETEKVEAPAGSAERANDVLSDKTFEPKDNSACGNGYHQWRHYPENRTIICDVCSCSRSDT